MDLTVLSTLSNPKPKPKFTFEAIGTQWVIETPVSLDDALKTAISARIEKFDQTYSRFRSDSLVSEVAKQSGVFEFPQDSEVLVGFYETLYDATDGKVTPLIGRALAQSGYDADYSFVRHKVDDVPRWDEVMAWQGSRLETSRPILLDFGAAGKGYLVDIIGELLKRSGVYEYVIDASGDIRHRGEEVDSIGLENPHDGSRVIGVMNLQNASLCASASNRRQWAGEMHHILDPDLRSPTRAIVATWVRAENTMMADGLATALFFTDGERLREKWDFEYVCLYANGKITHSHEFMGELFI